MVQIWGNPKNTSEWTACNLFFVKQKYFKLKNPYNISTSKCSIHLPTKTRCVRRFIFSNVCGVISRNLLPHIESSAKFKSPLNALNFIVSISQWLTEISPSSVSRVEIHLSFSKDVMLLRSSKSFRTFVGKIKEYFLMLNLNSLRSIRLSHTCIPQDILLSILLAGSPTITVISQQVLPTTATPTPQSVWMA